MEQNFRGLLKAGMQCIKKGIDKNGLPLYILIGNLINPNEASRNQLVKNLTQYLSTIFPFREYVLIHYLQDDKLVIQDEVKDLFKYILRNLTPNHQKRLQKIIIIDKALNTSQAQKIIKSEKAVCIQEVTDLQNHDIQLHQSILLSLNAKNGIVALNEPFYGRLIQNYPISKNGIPLFLDEILNYLTSNTAFLASQGVFRLCGSYQLEQELVEKLRMQDYAAIKTYAPDVVSTVLKNSLVNLKEPLFPFLIYEDLKSKPTDCSDSKLFEMFEMFFGHMHEFNIKTVKRIAIFLKYVATFEQTSLMDTHNLSVVFAPCFFRPRNQNSFDIEGAKVVVHYFRRLIENVEYFLPGRLQSQ